MSNIEHFRSEVYLYNNNKLLMGKNTKDGIFEIIGGHIDKFESPKIAAIRECKEEVAIKVLSLEKIWEVSNNINAIIHSYKSNNFITDKTLYGTEPDMLKQIWVPFSDAIRILKMQLSNCDDNEYAKLINKNAIEVINKLT